jgi:hypothetical protein
LILQFSLFSFCNISKVTIVNSFISFCQFLSFFRKFSSRHEIRRSQLEVPVLENLDETRFSIRTKEARSRVQMAPFSPAVATCVDGALAGSGFGQDAKAESNNSDDEQSDVEDDSDSEDF